MSFSSTLYVYGVFPSALYSGRSFHSYFQPSDALTVLLSICSLFLFKITVMLSGSFVPSGTFQYFSPLTSVLSLFVFVISYPSTLASYPGIGVSLTVYVCTDFPFSVYFGRSFHSYFQPSCFVTVLASPYCAPSWYRVTVMLSGNSVPSGTFQDLLPFTSVVPVMVFTRS